MVRKISIAVFLALSGTFSLNAQYENVRISGSFGPDKLSNTLRRLKSDYGIRLAYDPVAMDSLEGTFVFAEKGINEVMTELLDQSPFGYAIIRRTVVIYRLPEKVGPVSAGSLKSDFTWSSLIVDAQSGESLPFAVARLRGTAIGGEADGEGRLTIRNVPSDTCVILLSYTGYEDRELRLNAISGQTSIGLWPRQTLLPLAIIEGHYPDLLEVVEDPGVLSFNPGDLTTISTNGEADVLRAVQLLPGITATTESSNGLIIRGSDPDQVLVQFDDFTLFHFDHFFGAFSAINADAVKQVRVYKGGLESTMGGRIGGVVRITGKEGSTLRPSARLTLGPLSANLFLESPVGRSGSVMIAARRSYIDFIPTPVFRNLYTTAYRQGNSGTQSKDIFSGQNDPAFFYQDLTAKYTWKNTRGDKINFSGYLGRDNLVHRFRIDQLEQGISSRYADESSWGNSGAGFRWTREHRAGNAFLLTLGASRYESNYFSADTIFNSISGLTTTSFSDEVFGLSDYNARIENRRVFHSAEYTFGLHCNLTDIANSSGPEGSARMASSAGTTASYVQMKYELPKWKIVPGVRMNYFSRSRQVYPEWRLNACFKPTSSLTIKGSFARVHQFLHRVKSQSLNLNSSDLWLISGDAALPVLRSDQVTAGFNLASGNWEFDLEAYYKSNSGTFEYLGAYGFQTGSGDSLSVGTGFSRGIDMLVRFEKKKNHCWMSYSWSRSENVLNSPPDTRVPEWFDQRHEGKVYYELEYGKWEFALTFLIGSGRPYTPLLGSFQIPLPDGTEVSSPVFGQLNSARLPVYHRLDLAASWKFHVRRVSNVLRLSLFNVYNRTNLSNIRYLASGSPDDNFGVLKQEVGLSGIVPGIQLQIQFE